MNLPNKLTMARIILIPVFVLFMFAEFIPWHNFVALAIFIIASLTDMLDGMLARKMKLVTNFGKFMDPLADKLLVITALLCLLSIKEGKYLCYIGDKALPFTQKIAALGIIIIVAREFVISGFRLVASDAGIVIAASIWGKIKTATTMVAICVIIASMEEALAVLTIPAQVLFWISVVLTVVSLVDYIVKNIAVIGDASGGTAAKKEEGEAKEENEKKKDKSSEKIKNDEIRLPGKNTEEE